MACCCCVVVVVLLLLLVLALVLMLMLVAGVWRLWYWCWNVWEHSIGCPRQLVVAIARYGWPFSELCGIRLLCASNMSVCSWFGCALLELHWYRNFVCV
jgi:hypothetical protein